MRRRRKSSRSPSGSLGPDHRVSQQSHSATAPDWTARAAWIVITVFGLAMIAVAVWLHPVGDYFTESDFYEYVAGGRAIAHGIVDPGRYVIIGPVFEFVLAALASLPVEPFRSATILSVLAACATLALWFVLLRRRSGSAVGLWAVLFFAASPVFCRYAYSATTDVLAVSLQSASIFALLAMRGPRAPLWAGVLAAFTTLTRYTGVFLVPAALLTLAWLERSRARPLRSVALYLAGFGVVMLPWVAFTAQSGHLPGENLLRNYAFYTEESASARNVQDLSPDSVQSVRPEQPEPAPGPAALLTGWASRIPEHLISDLRTLIGWPVAIVCLIGVIMARRRRELLPIWIHGVVLLSVLALAFYSDRYSMALVPIYMTLGGIAVADLLPGIRIPGLSVPLTWLFALVPLWLSIHASIALQRSVRTQLPVEVLPAAHALESMASPGAAVLARKAAIAHYSGLRYVSFPHISTLDELAAHARKTRADFLYFSWYEGELRPEFWYLLDTTVVIPGLTRVFTVDENPAILYRVGARFGEPPAWLSDPSLKRFHDLSGYVRVLAPAAAYPTHHWLGVEAASRGSATVALSHFRQMTRGRPGEEAGWMLRGQESADLGLYEEALEAYRRAEQIHPRNLAARMGRGLAEFHLGRVRSAAVTLRPALEHVPDRSVLEALEARYRSMGDAASAARAREAVRSAAATPAQ